MLKCFLLLNLIFLQIFTPFLHAHSIEKQGRHIHADEHSSSLVLSLWQHHEQYAEAGHHHVFTMDACLPATSLAKLLIVQVDWYVSGVAPTLPPTPASSQPKLLFAVAFSPPKRISPTHPRAPPIV